MPNETRTRMIEATVVALQRRGVAGMSFTDVLGNSGAARGAIYHHFPGGKAQLVAEAAEGNGEAVRARLATLPATSPWAVVTSFLAAVRPVVEASAGGNGCAVAALSVGTGAEGDDALRRVASAAFASWTDQVGERLTAAGLKPQEAADLAATLIILLEGALVLCRAAASIDPFDRAARTARTLVQNRLPR